MRLREVFKLAHREYAGLRARSRATVVVIGIASAIVAGWSLANQEMLGVQAVLAFGLRETPEVMWYGTNAGTLVILAAMLLMAPVCVVMNRKRLK